MNAIAMEAGREKMLDAALKAVIFYEDPKFAARATALLERVAARAEDGLKWDVKIWRLDVLQKPELAAVTLAFAADADLIVLAASRTDAAPAELLDWLDGWARHRKFADAALLALCPDATAAPTAFWCQLKGFAAQRELHFLDHRGAEPDSFRLLRPLPRQEPTGSMDVQRIEDPQPMPLHWGINE